MNLGKLLAKLNYIAKSQLRQLEKLKKRLMAVNGQNISSSVLQE